MNIFRTAVPSQEGTKTRSKGKVSLLKTLCGAVIVAVVSSGFPLSPAQASGTYDGTDGTVLCSTSGHFTIALNAVTGHTECAGAVVIPASVTSIGSGGFAGSSITSVDFSGTNTLATIGGSAFQSIPTLTSITIPASVTSIGDSAFAFSMALTSILVDAANANYSSVGGVLFDKDKTLVVQYPSGISETPYVIPSTVTSIGTSAFRGSILSSINIPASVTSIGESAFGGSQLTSVVFSGTSTLATIGGYAFNATTSLTSISIPASVTSIGIGAFSNATALASVVFSGTSTLANIGEQAFESSGLTSITIPASVTSIGIAAFRYAHSLESVVFAGTSTLATIDVQAFSSSGLTSISIPASVTSIGISAFDGAFGLASVVFSDTSTLATIGAYAFSGASFTSLTIPASVTTIGASAFFSRSLVSITVEEANLDYSSLDGVLFNKPKTTLITYPASKLATTYSIPTSVTRIEASAFSETSALTSVTIPTSVTTIGDRVFHSAVALTSITVAADNQNYSSLDGVLFDKQKTSVINYPMSNLTKTYSIPSSVTSVEAFAFYGAPFYAVTIPSSTAVIRNNAFMYARSNLNVYFLGNEPPTVSNDAFDGVAGKAYIKTGATGFAAEGSTWKGLTVAVLDDGVRPCTTGTYVIQDFIATNGTYCAGTAVIADGVQAINNEAFSSNEVLTSVTIPASVMSIGSNSFGQTYALTSFSVDSANPNFSSEAGVLFNKNKSSLLLFPAARGNAPYTVPGSVVTIAARAFLMDRSLTSITIPENVESIDEYAFFGAEKLTSVTFSGTSKLASIGRLSFKQSNLESINIPASVTVIGAEAFALTPLRTITFDEGSPITTIESSTFEGVPNLTSITIPASVTSIKSYAFYGASKLTNVVFLGNSPTSVGVEAFTDVAAGAKATISASATGFPAVGSAWYGLTVATAPPPAVTPPAVTPPAVTPPAVTPPAAAIVTTTPVLSAVGTSVAIAREPSAAVASAVAIGVSKTKVMVALKVPKASKSANQVTKYVIQLKSAKGVTITKTISVRAGGTVKPTLTGKKKTSYSMTVTAVTKSGKKTTWKGPQVKTS